MRQGPNAAWLIGACLLTEAGNAAADPLNLYLGTGLGYATVQQSFVPLGVVEHPLGWKVFVGWRPIQLLGAEVEYADLGSRNSTSFGSYVNSEQAQARAVAAFAMGYLPQPLPYLDFYGKLEGFSTPDGDQSLLSLDAAFNF